jgi:hypothetical protein
MPECDGPQPSHQDTIHRVRFRLLHLIGLTTRLSLGLACLIHADATFVFAAVVVTNVIGMIVGLLLTFVGGLPNDGSLPPGCVADDASP